MKEFLGLKRLRSGKKRPEGQQLQELSRSREVDRNRRAQVVFENWKAAGFPLTYSNAEVPILEGAGSAAVEPESMSGREV